VSTAWLSHYLIGGREEPQRTLKGYLILHTLPNRWALRYGYPLLRLLLPRLPRDPRTDYEPEVHVNEQDILSLKRSLNEAGLSSKVWLENLTVERAVWRGAETEFTDIRGEAYPFLRHPLVRAMIFLLMCTPLRLIVANDIYAIAWRPDGEGPQALKGKGLSILDDKNLPILHRATIHNEGAQNGKTA